MSRNKPLPPSERIVHLRMPVSLIDWLDEQQAGIKPKLARGKVVTALLSDARIQGARITGYSIDVTLDVDRPGKTEARG